MSGELGLAVDVVRMAVRGLATAEGIDVDGGEHDGSVGERKERPAPDPVARFSLALCHKRLCTLYKAQGAIARAEASIVTSISILEGLGRGPLGGAVTKDLAHAHYLLACVLCAQDNRSTEARDADKKALVHGLSGKE